MPEMLVIQGRSVSVVVLGSLLSPQKHVSAFTRTHDRHTRPSGKKRVYLWREGSCGGPRDPYVDVMPTARQWPRDTLQARHLEGPGGHLGPGGGGGPTLSHESLAGVQQDLAAFNNHALNGEVFPDVLRLAHFVMHYPAGTGNKSGAGGGDARPLARPSGKAWPRGLSEPAVTKGERTRIY